MTKGNVPIFKGHKQDDLYAFGDKDAEDLVPEDSISTLETIDSFVGPVKAEFDDLKKLIEN